MHWLPLGHMSFTGPISEGRGVAKALSHLKTPNEMGLLQVGSALGFTSKFQPIQEMEGPEKACEESDRRGIGRR